MPLVRISGGDAATFDTFDVAEMADGRGERSQRSSWSSRHSGVGSTSNTRHAKHGSSSTPETDDDSSSGRRSEEADRVGSISSRGFSGMRGHSQSSLSSTNSYHTNSSSYDNTRANTSSSPYSNHRGAPTYQTVDDLDEMEHDPRNSFNKGQNSLRASWGENIPEEDETSLSTMEDSSTSPSVQQQQQPNQYQNPHSRSNSQQMHQSQHRSHRHRPKHQPPISEDDVSVLSHSSRQDVNRRPSDTSSHMISQLESQVMKLNFELATTKSTLDELELEHRRLNDDRDKISNDVTLLKEENEQLHLKIERLEREKILRNMEGTKGAARTVTDQDWGGAAGSGNTWANDNGGASSNRVYVPMTTKKLGKVEGGLEVPFRSETNRRNSLCSVTSFNELSVDCDNMSRGDQSAHSIALSAHSIALSDSDYNAETFQASNDAEELDQSSLRGRMDIIGNMFGKRPSVRETTKQMEAASISSPSRRRSNVDEASISSQPSSSKRQERYSEGDAAPDNEDDIGSNPQGEDFNDDDPFATWSMAGDPKRKEPERKWLQGGLGAMGRDLTKRQPPQSEEIIEDPFDTCKGSDDDDDDDYGDADGYTSFADNASDRSRGFNNKDGNSGAAGQGRRFGFLRLGARRS